MTEKTALDLLAERVRHLETLEEIMSNIYGWDGSAWQKLPLVWGYSDRYSEQVRELDAAVNDELLTTAVSAEYVHVINAVTVFNYTTAFTRLEVLVYAGAVAGPHLIYQIDPVEVQPYMWEGSLVLKQGDVVRAFFTGNTLGDDLYMRVWGYKMLVNA